MFVTARKLLAAGARSRRARVAVQALVSLALILLLLRAAPQDSLAAAWQAVGWQTLLMASACYGVAIVASARRWQLLLRHQGTDEGLVQLSEIYLVGLFCSLFLPTSAGGDAYRVFEVCRRGASMARVLLATLQDRLLGLGGMMLLGLFAALWHSDLLPTKLLLAVLGVYGFGILAVLGTLHCGRVLRLGLALLARLLPKVPTRVLAFLQPLCDAVPPGPWCTLRVVSLAIVTFLATVAMYAIVGAAVGADCGILALCLVVSLVALVRMLPISLGGLGVGEEAFVVLMGLFGIGSDLAAPIALVVLGVSVAVNLFGGLLLLRRMFATAAAAPEAVLLPFPAAAEQEGDRRVA